MRFVMPSKYDEQSLPRPNDSRVKLEKSQAEYVAVLKFGGYANDGKIARYSEKLRKALEKKGDQLFRELSLPGLQSALSVHRQKERDHCLCQLDGMSNCWISADPGSMTP